jgi:hypothetical protein
MPRIGRISLTERAKREANPDAEAKEEAAMAVRVEAMKDRPRKAAQKPD